MTVSAERHIRSVVTTLPLGRDDVALLRRSLGSARFLQLGEDDPRLAEALETSDVALLGATVDDRALTSPTLRWVHFDVAGLERAAHPWVFHRDLIITGSAGRSAPALAQHAFYLALALTFDGPGLWEQQKRHVWGGLAGYHHREALWGKTLGIIGLGHTGRAVATLGGAFGMRVWAHGRSVTVVPPEIQRFTCEERGESVDGLLSESDVVVLTCPLTDVTRHLVDARRLSVMKRSAYLVNLARGAVVDEAALVDALVRGEIAGAGLDVLECEPPARDAAIWSAPNVIITPHVTPMLPDRAQRSVRIIAENARRFCAGQPMVNVLRPEDAYTGRAAGPAPCRPDPPPPSTARVDSRTSEALS